MLKDDALLRADIFLTNLHEARRILLRHAKRGGVINIAARRAKKKKKKAIDALYRKYMIDPMPPHPQPEINRPELRKILSYKNDPRFRK